MEVVAKHSAKSRCVVLPRFIVRIFPVAFQAMQIFKAKFKVICVVVYRCLVINAARGGRKPNSTKYIGWQLSFAHPSVNHQCVGTVHVQTWDPPFVHYAPGWCKQVVVGGAETRHVVVRPVETQPALDDQHHHIA